MKAYLKNHHPVLLKLTIISILKTKKKKNEKNPSTHRLNGVAPNSFHNTPSADKILTMAKKQAKFGLNFWG